MRALVSGCVNGRGRVLDVANGLRHFSFIAEVDLQDGGRVCSSQARADGVVASALKGLDDLAA